MLFFFDFKVLKIFLNKVFQKSLHKQHKKYFSLILILKIK